MPRRVEPPYRFLVDECLGTVHVPNAVRAVLESDERLLVFGEHFDRGTPDHVWLREAGKQKLVILTKDGRMRHRPNELKALLAAEVAVFTVAADVAGPKMAAALAAAMPTIRRVLRGCEPPVVGHAMPDGSVMLRIVAGEPSGKKVKRPR